MLGVDNSQRFSVFLPSLLLIGGVFFVPDIFIDRFRVAPFLYVGILSVFIFCVIFSINKLNFYALPRSFTVLIAIWFTFRMVMSHFDLQTILSALTIVLIFFIFFHYIQEEKYINRLFYLLFCISGILVLGCAFQYLKILPSYNSSFSITGPFDNPAGISSLLAALFPFSLFVHTRIFGKKSKILIVFFAFAIIVAIFLIKSRAGLLAIIASSLPFIVEKGYMKSLRNRIFVLTGFAALCIVLYFSKIPSADGRILIWLNSMDIIRDYPFFGSGNNGFYKHYMSYQADFFSTYHNHPYELLAGNTFHPFNEFLKELINWGFLGFVLSASIFIYAISCYFKNKKPFKKYALASLFAILTFSLFSYPISYPIIQMLLAFNIAVLLYDSHKYRDYNSFKVPLLVWWSVSLFLLSIFVYVATCELKWKMLTDTEPDIAQYELLYQKKYLQNHPSFLHDYAVALHEMQDYKRSMQILNECMLMMDNYDTRMLQGYNFRLLGELEIANHHFSRASKMIPNRFVPLYEIMLLYDTMNKHEKVRELAVVIDEKQVKAASQKITYIKEAARKILNKNGEEVEYMRK